MAVALLLLLLMLDAASLRTFGVSGGTQFSASQGAVSLLVLPLENAGRNARLDWLGEGFAELNMDRLKAPGRLVYAREEWQAAVERLGLPTAPESTSRFSRATMLKLAELLDADGVVFGRYTSDGKSLSVMLRVLRQTPVELSPAFEESGALEEVMEIHARVMWSVLRHVDPMFPLSRNDYVQQSRRFRLDAFENYVRGSLAGEDGQKLLLWREAARLDPEWSEPLFALGQYYFAAKDYAAAQGWFARVPPAAERFPAATFYSGTCLLLRNDPAGAERILALLIEGELNKRAASEALNNLALARARQQKWPEAAALLQRATQQSPDEPDLWLNLSLVYLRGGDATAAVRALREALRLRPAEPAARALLIFALEKAGRPSEAAAERDQNDAKLPEVSEATLARFERVKMRLEPAVGELTGANGTLSARRAQTLRRFLVRGREALEAGRFQDAQRLFASALLLKPDSAEGHVGLAEAHEKLGNIQDAIREWRAALWTRDDGAVRIRLAQALLRTEPPLRNEARAELRTALRLPLSARQRDEARKLLSALEGQ